MALAAGLIATGVAPPVRADLPSLSDKEWLGYFVGYANRDFRFGIESKGPGAIQILDSKGMPLSKKLDIDVTIAIEETQPDGKVVQRKVQSDSLESAQAATNQPENVVIRGKVTGDATFEMTVSESHGTIALGARLVDQGKLTKNPLKLSVRIKFPDAYPSRKADPTKQELKKWEKETSGDRVQLALANNKREKLDPSEAEPEKLAEVAKAGVTAARVEFSTYKDRRIEITAPAGTAMTLAPDSGKPLRDGFTLDWTPDPEGAKRLTIQVK